MTIFFEGFVDTKLTIVLHLREQVILLITIFVFEIGDSVRKTISN